MVSQISARETPVWRRSGSTRFFAEGLGAEIAYDGTPVAPLISLIDAKAEIADRYGELSVPLLLFTSYDDHVVPPDQSRHLAATYGAGDGTLVDHVWLERSYHVATQDHDRDLITERMLEFVGRVTA